MGVQPSPGWASLAAELLAEMLVELADGFDGEATYGGEAAVGLAVAAAVLRDRAGECLIGTCTFGLPGVGKRE